MSNNRIFSSKNPNLGLAVSRNIGDHEFASSCAEASVDSLSIQEYTAKITPHKLYVVMACDGFTEKAAEQTKEGHEYYLEYCIKYQIGFIKNIGDFAKSLVTLAYQHGSEDNISIAVRELPLIGAQPFIMGVFDGHRGNQASAYAAYHLTSAFIGQCRLSQGDYAEHFASIHQNVAAFARDNSTLVPIKPHESVSDMGLFAQHAASSDKSTKELNSGPSA